MPSEHYSRAAMTLGDELAVATTIANDRTHTLEEVDR